MIGRLRSLAHFHPDLRVAALFAPRRAVSPRSLPVLRVLTGAIRGTDPDIHVLEPGVAVRYFRPSTVADGEPGPALLWIHGGGYVFGRAAQDDELCRRFAERLGITVASVEYRLAPEHPYPTPLEDCYRAYQRLLHRPEVDATRVAIGGASAGAGLAAALAFLARDRDTTVPVFQLLAYPMLDDRTATGPEHMRMWDGVANRFGWSSYLGDADPDVAVPARRTDLQGLPPAWIAVGSNDLFFDENKQYADGLGDAGIACEFHVVPGAFHGFDSVVPRSGVARAFFDTQCAALGAVLTA
ncbi:alpha/beta hydrolase [Rhodococcus chondri]|uniref:Alpha/beta hydrolase n=1 Tax=Rhodococcus chondri TaxID=3065941 RepID=A0ABU7JZI8_9NOCA|nr:alpha/beta hydrolase [Rhodococcus sp. CC-R104]MEE2035428.1 alpha/beta hydrolase [Rhodococcus sp. CC-R104]